MDGVFQGKIEGGKGVCEEEKYEQSVCVSVNTQKHTLCRTL